MLSDPAKMSRGTATEIHGTDRKGCAVAAGREIDRVFDRLHSILRGARVNRTIAEEINGRTFGIANGEAEKDGAGVPESHLGHLHCVLDAIAAEIGRANDETVGRESGRARVCPSV